MKKILYPIAFLALATTIFSCKEAEPAPLQIEKASWLIGTWENKSADGILTESWTKTNDSVYSGRSYFIKGKDTLHNEFIELWQKGDEVIYSAKVIGENNNRAIPFNMSGDSIKQLVFENPKHDYPQKIVYTKVTEDSIVAEISGKLNRKKFYSEKYPMKKKE